MKNMVTGVTRCKMQQFLTRTWIFAWLLVGYSFMLCCNCSMRLFMRYPIKEDTNLEKITGALFEKYWHFVSISCCICEVYGKCP